MINLRNLHDKRQYTTDKISKPIIPLEIHRCEHKRKKIMTAEEYLETGKFIWQTYVPGNPDKLKLFKVNS
ncbi:MAG: hypothetical protein IPP51_10435 [Bacteroidetes bacterium]|nr:hypothetical protein [Bacteroidota bacterium]